MAREKASLEDLGSVLQHLVEACPVCREAVEEFFVLGGTERATGPEAERDYPGLELDSLRRIGDRVWRQVEMIERERILAPRLWDEVAALPAAERRAVVERERRFHVSGFADRLLDGSSQQFAEDPAQAEELADLALTVTERVPPGRLGEAHWNDLQARTWSMLGNARRLRRELRRAEEALRIAEHHLEQGSGDVMAKGRLLDFRALLRESQRRFPEALSLADRAAAVYRSAGELRAAARTLLEKARIHSDAGDPEAAIRALERAARGIDGVREPRLWYRLRHELAFSLADAGRTAEAAALLPEVRALAAGQADEPDLARLAWLEGRVAAGLDRPEEAEERLVAAREGLLAHGRGYDAALVSLDLAGLYAAAGRTAELRRLAAAMPQVLEAEGIHAEALAALHVFQRAAEAESASLDLLRRIADYLAAARHQPDLRFDPAA